MSKREAKEAAERWAKKLGSNIWKRADGTWKFYCSNCRTWIFEAEYVGEFKKRGDFCSLCRLKNIVRKPGRKRLNRLSVNLRLRFAILSRDKFTCQYCGRSAPHVELQVDHILPVVKGGTNDRENLITACFDCNMGKHDRCL